MNRLRSQLTQHFRAMHGKRRGFSLLEMMLALAILGGSLAVLAQIAETGTDAAREARALSNARMLCQTKLNEELLNVVAGIAPVTVIDAAADPFDSQAVETFTYSVEVGPGQLDGLLNVRVTATAWGNNGQRQIAVYALDRWVIDPQMGLEEMELEEELAREEIASGGEEL